MNKDVVSLEDIKRFFEYEKTNKDSYICLAREMLDPIYDFIKVYQETSLQLQQRIDKAIEYIENKKAIINTDYIRLFDLFKIEEQGYTDKLLSILKGSENND